MKLTNSMLEFKTQIKSVKLVNCTQEEVQYLAHLTSLSFKEYTKININSLTNLTCLDSRNRKIRYDNLTNLTELSANNYEKIDISQFTNLIKLSYNFLHDHMFAKLTNLTYLSVSREIINVNHLIKLTYLDISSSELVNSVSALTNLTELHLPDTNLDISNLIPDLPNLTKLHIGFSHVNINFPKLTYLSSLSPVDDQELSKLTNLVNLEICDNQFITSETLSRLTNLTYLHARDKYYGELFLPKIKDLACNISNDSLSKLTTVEILFGSVYLDDSTVSQLVNLRELYLVNDLVTNDGLKDLAYLTSLECFSSIDFSLLNLKHSYKF